MTEKITPEQIQKMIKQARVEVRPLEDAAAAEEIATAKAARSVGRPSIAGGEPSEQIAVRVPTSLRKAMMERARAENKTVAAWTREAIEDHLAA